MSSSSARQPGLATTRFAVETSAAAHRLNLLDDLWTACATAYSQAGAAGNAQVGGEDREELETLIDEMQELVVDIRERAEGIGALVATLGEGEVDRALAEVLAAFPDRDRLLDDLGVGPNGEGFSTTLVAACEDIQARGGEEMEGLHSEAKALLRGRAVAGDFKLSFKCSLLVLGAGALVIGGALAGAVAGIAVGAVALGAAGGGIGGAGSALVALAASPCTGPDPATA